MSENPPGFIENINSFQYEKICRTCLKEGDMINFFERILIGEEPFILHEVMLFTTKIQVKEGDSLPKNICMKCIEELYNSFKFIIGCNKADRTLRNYINTEKDIIFETKDDYLETAEQVIGNTAGSDIDLLESALDDIPEDDLKEEVKEEIIQENIETVETVEYVTENDVLENVASVVEVKEEPPVKRKRGRPRKQRCKKCFPDATSTRLRCKHTVPRLKLRQQRPRAVTCTVCALSIRRIHYARHFKKHTHTAHQCRICSLAFLTDAKLKDHLKGHTGEKPHICQQCGKCFDDQEQLEDHEKLHGINVNKIQKSLDTDELPYYKCRICSEIYNNSTNLKAHQLTHTEKTHFCEKCNLDFYTLSGLINHRNAHIFEPDKKREKKLQNTHILYCDKCKIDFFNMVEYEEHNLKHKLDLNLNEEISIDKKLFCQFCGVLQYSEHDLQEHQNELHAQEVHESLVKNTCEECDYVGKDRDEYFEHLKTHNEQQPTLTCKICNNVSENIVELLKHKATHQTDCVKCNLKFDTKEKLTEHEQNCTKVKCRKVPMSKKQLQEICRQIQSCEFCNINFLTIEKLIIHQTICEEKQKEGVVPLVCNTCKIEYLTEAKLNIHKQNCETKPISDADILCTNCKSLFICSEDLIEHKKVCLDKKLICDDCKTHCFTIENMNKHKQNCKGKDIELVSTRFKCESCKILFETSNLKENHICKKESFICETCGSVFDSKIKFDEHNNVCSLEKEVIRNFLELDTQKVRVEPARNVLEAQNTCENCQKNFATHGILQDHKKSCALQMEGIIKSESKVKGKKRRSKSESRVTAHYCNICYMSYSSSKALTNHLKTCYVEDDYDEILKNIICKTCNTSFPSKEMDEHVKKHLIDKRKNESGTNTELNTIVETVESEKVVKTKINIQSDIKIQMARSVSESDIKSLSETKIKLTKSKTGRKPQIETDVLSAQKDLSNECETIETVDSSKRPKRSIKNWVIEKLKIPRKSRKSDDAKIEDKIAQKGKNKPKKLAGDEIIKTHVENDQGVKIVKKIGKADKKVGNTGKKITKTDKKVVKTDQTSGETDEKCVRIGKKVVKNEKKGSEIVKSEDKVIKTDEEDIKNDKTGEIDDKIFINENISPQPVGKSSRKRSKKSVSDPKEFICICGVDCITLDRLLLHKQLCLVNIEAQNQIQKCQYCYKESSDIVNHIKECENNHICELCNFNCKYKDILMDHKQFCMKTKAQKPLTNEISLGVYLCPFCSVNCHTKSTLVDHQYFCDKKPTKGIVDKSPMSSLGLWKDISISEIESLKNDPNKINNEDNKTIEKISELNDLSNIDFEDSESDIDTITLDSSSDDDIETWNQPNDEKKCTDIVLKIGTKIKDSEHTVSELKFNEYSTAETSGSNLSTEEYEKRLIEVLESSSKKDILKNINTNKNNESEQEIPSKLETAAPETSKQSTTVQPKPETELDIVSLKSEICKKKLEYQELKQKIIKELENVVKDKQDLAQKSEFANTFKESKEIFENLGSILPQEIVQKVVKEPLEKQLAQNKEVTVSKITQKSDKNESNSTKIQKSVSKDHLAQITEILASKIQEPDIKIMPSTSGISETREMRKRKQKSPHKSVFKESKQPVSENIQKSIDLVVPSTSKQVQTLLEPKEKIKRKQKSPQRFSSQNNQERTVFTNETNQSEQVERRRSLKNITETSLDEFMQQHQEINVEKIEQTIEKVEETSIEKDKKRKRTQRSPKIVTKRSKTQTGRAEEVENEFTKDIVHISDEIKLKAVEKIIIETDTVSSFVESGKSSIITLEQMNLIEKAVSELCEENICDSPQTVVQTKTSKSPKKTNKSLEKASIIQELSEENIEKGKKSPVKRVTQLNEEKSPSSSTKRRSKSRSPVKSLSEDSVVSNPRQSTSKTIDLVVEKLETVKKSDLQIEIELVETSSGELTTPASRLSEKQRTPSPQKVLQIEKVTSETSVDETKRLTSPGPRTSGRKLTPSARRSIKALQTPPIEISSDDTSTDSNLTKKRRSVSKSPQKTLITTTDVVEMPSGKLSGRSLTPSASPEKVLLTKITPIEISSDDTSTDSSLTRKRRGSRSPTKAPQTSTEMDETEIKLTGVKSVEKVSETPKETSTKTTLDEILVKISVGTRLTPGPESPEKESPKLTSPETKSTEKLLTSCQNPEEVLNVEDTEALIDANLTRSKSTETLTDDETETAFYITRQINLSENMTDENLELPEQKPLRRSRSRTKRSKKNPVSKDVPKKGILKKQTRTKSDVVQDTNKEISNENMVTKLTNSMVQERTRSRTKSNSEINERESSKDEKITSNRSETKRPGTRSKSNEIRTVTSSNEINESNILDEKLIKERRRRSNSNIDASIKDRSSRGKTPINIDSLDSTGSITKNDENNLAKEPSEIRNVDTSNDSTIRQESTRSRTKSSSEGNRSKSPIKERSIRARSKSKKIPDTISVDLLAIKSKDPIDSFDEEKSAQNLDENGTGLKEDELYESLERNESKSDESVTMKTEIIKYQEKGIINPTKSDVKDVSKGRNRSRTKSSSKETLGIEESNENDIKYSPIKSGSRSKSQIKEVSEDSREEVDLKQKSRARSRSKSKSKDSREETDKQKGSVRSRSRSKSQIKDTLEDSRDEVDLKPKSRARSRSKSKSKVLETSENSREETDKQKEPVRSRSRSKSQIKDIDNSREDIVLKSRARSRSKSKSKILETSENSREEIDERNTPVRSRSRSKSQIKDISDNSREEIVSKSPAKSRSKSKSKVLETSENSREEIDERNTPVRSRSRSKSQIKDISDISREDVDLKPKGRQRSSSKSISKVEDPTEISLEETSGVRPLSRSKSVIRDTSENSKEQNIEKSPSRTRGKNEDIEKSGEEIKHPVRRPRSRTKKILDKSENSKEINIKQSNPRPHLGGNNKQETPEEINKLKSLGKIQDTLKEHNKQSKSRSRTKSQTNEPNESPTIKEETSPPSKRFRIDTKRIKILASENDDDVIDVTDDPKLERSPLTIEDVIDLTFDDYEVPNKENHFHSLIKKEKSSEITTPEHIKQKYGNAISEQHLKIIIESQKLKLKTPRFKRTAIFNESECKRPKLGINCEE